MVVAEGLAVGLGYNQEFKMVMKGIGTPEETVANSVTVGGMYNVGLDYGSVSAAEIKKIQQNIEELKTTIDVNNIYTDNAMGEILNAVAKAYFAQLDLYDDVLSGQHKVASNRLLSEAITGYNPRVKYMFMCPVEVNEGSMYIDVDRNVKSVISLDGNHDSEKGYMVASGIFSSAMEHRIFEQMTGTPSVSAIKIFEEANARGIPLYNIDKNNVNEILPKLEISNSIKTDIINAVNSEKIVMIPQRNIQYFDWYGVGYIVLNPETGAAGYMISGGIAGGSMSFNEVLDRYVTYVTAGIIGMILFDIVEMLLLACLPGGWAVGIIFGIKLIAIGLAIYNMFNLYQQYASTGEVRYLQEMLIELSAICTLGAIRLGPLKELFAESASLKVTIAEMKAQGIPAKTTLNFLTTYGIGKFSQAKATIGTFTKYGITGNQLFDISQSFDRLTIASIETTYIKAGILGTQDYDMIAILFKQVGSASGASSLSNSIVALSESGIVPYTYSIYGIVGINGVISAVSAISKGIIPSTMKLLADVGIKTTDYEIYGITTQSAAEAVAEAIEAGIAETELTAINEFLERAAGQFGSTRNAIQAFKYLSSGDFTSFADMLDLSTPAGKAVFWSGDKAAAIRYAESIGGSALETTPGGKLLNDWNWLSIKFPAWGDESATDLRELWIAVSDRYANLVEGPVTVVRPGGEAGTGGYIWNNVEFKVLNDRHITIYYVDSADVP